MGDRDRVYVQQTSFRITLICNVDIATATVLKIKYKKPDKTLGEFIAVSSNDPFGHIYYDVVNTNDFDQAGTWVLWSWVTFADGRYAPGDPEKLEIHEEGSI